MAEPVPAAVAEWEAEHGRPHDGCGVPGCTDGHDHAPTSAEREEILRAVAKERQSD